MELGDPYLLAYLNGGARHATRVALANLVTRGLLRVPSRGRVEPGDPPGVARLDPTERELIERSPTRVEDLLTVAEPMGWFEDRRRALDDLGLLARPVKQGALAIAGVGGLVLLSFVVGAPPATAIVFAALLVVVAWRLTRRRTRRGDRALADARELYRPLRRFHGVSQDQVADAAVVAALFGVATLSDDVRRMFRAPPHRPTGCGATCGSGCSDFAAAEIGGHTWGGDTGGGHHGCGGGHDAGHHGCGGADGGGHGCGGDGGGGCGGGGCGGGGCGS